MLRTLGRMTLGMAAMAAVVVGGAVAQDKGDKKEVTIKDIMKACTGGKGFCSVAVKEAKASKWDKAEIAAGELKKYGELMAKAPKPEKGTKESWEKMTKMFAKNSTAVYTSVEKKDLDGTQKAGATFAKSCKACHDAHKED